MVTDLQHVNRPQCIASQERRLDRRLGVAGQQGSEAAVAEEQHHRAVVDVALRKQRRRIGG